MTKLVKVLHDFLVKISIGKLAIEKLHYSHLITFYVIQ